MSFFPEVSDSQLEQIRAEHPTAFRVRYACPVTHEPYGDLVLRKPTRPEVKRFKDAAKKGLDTGFIVRACLVAPALSVWDEVTAQELSGLPETVEDDLLKRSGILAEQDLGKR